MYRPSRIGRASEAVVSSRFRIVLLLALIGQIAGCAVGPTYEQPDVHPSDRWNDAPAADGALVSSWWEQFEDATLVSLVERGEAANPNLESAAAAVRASRASHAIARADWYPGINISWQYQRSENGGGRLGSGSSSNGGGQGNTSGGGNTYSVGFDTAWEIDLFGRIARSVEAAEADLAAAENDYGDALVSLRADVVSRYVTLRQQQERLRIARENVGLQERNAEIVRKRKDVGFATSLDLANAEVQALSTRSGIPSLEASISGEIYGLSVLLGREPASLMGELSNPVPLALPSDDPVLELPVSVIRQRPDIRAAEARLRAQTARVGVAVADLYPRFTVSGLLSMRGPNPSDVVDWGERFWNILTQASQPVFQGGRLSAEVERQRALLDQAAQQYHAAVLSALEEVNRALTSYIREKERAATLVTAVERSHSAVSTATELYRAGLVNFLDVLTAARAQYQSEDALAVSRYSAISHLVSLYRALGRGAEIARTELRPDAPALEVQSVLR